MSKSKSDTTNKTWLPQVWWVPIVVAVIGLMGVTIPLLINNNNQINPPSQTFDYLVRVQEKDKENKIPNAKGLPEFKFFQSMI